MRSPRSLREDRGASVVEFAMLSVLLVLLLFAVVQVALWFYARNITAAAAADGARLAATVPESSGAGATRARELIDSGLSGPLASHIACTDIATVDGGSGLPTRTVRCRGRLAATFLPFDLPFEIDARSSALVEGGR